MAKRVRGLSLENIFWRTLADQEIVPTAADDGLVSGDILYCCKDLRLPSSSRRRPSMRVDVEFLLGRQP